MCGITNAAFLASKAAFSIHRLHLRPPRARVSHLLSKSGSPCQSPPLALPWHLSYHVHVTGWASFPASPIVDAHKLTPTCCIIASPISNYAGAPTWPALSSLVPTAQQTGCETPGTPSMIQVGRAGIMPDLPMDPVSVFLASAVGRISQEQRQNC